MYQVRLAIAGGTSRGMWILFVIVSGMGAFFVSYLTAAQSDAADQSPPRGRQETQISVLGSAILLAFIALGFYSLIQFRTFRSEQEVVIEGGRFVGNVSGYQNSGYSFLFFPTAPL